MKHTKLCRITEIPLTLDVEASFLGLILRFGFLLEWKMKCNKIKWFTMVENHSVVLLKVRDVNKLFRM